MQPTTIMNLADFLSLSEGERALLESINFYGGSIGVAGAVALALVLPQCLALRHLDLCLNNIGDAGAEALAPVIPNSLQTLNLWDNGISDVGALAFARTWPTYKIYMRNGNNISDAVLHVLAQAPSRHNIFAFVAGGLTAKKSPAFSFFMKDGDGAVMSRVLRMLV